MARNGKSGQAVGQAPVAPDIGVLLDQIEREAVPERLLTLASKLQTALVARRLAERPGIRPVEPAMDQPT